jgi:glucose 1-dehydrogenase
VHVLNHHDSDVKSSLVRDLGGTFHVEGIAAVDRVRPDILMECTGAPSLIRDILSRGGSGGIVCLTGVTSSAKCHDFDIGLYNREMVLNNEAVFGTVNANRWHYEMAADALARADKEWLGRLITRRVPVERWSEAMEHRRDDIKVIVDFAA